MSSACATCPCASRTALLFMCPRAEPVSTLYEQGLVHHVWDLDDALSPAANSEIYPFAEMERQMVSVDLNDPKDHDDRLDAAVYAVTELLVDDDDPLGSLAAMAS